MKKFSKGAAYAVTLVMAGGLVAGCGTNNSAANTSSSTTSNTAATGKTVNFSDASGTIVWAAPPITHSGLRQTLINAFEKKYPKIKVVLQDQSSDTDTNRSSLATAIGGGSSTPDVFMGDVIWPAQFAANQLALPLSDSLPSSFWSRFSPGLVNGATYQGKVYAAPFFADSGFLYYRKDLLQKAGLPVPQTWQQLKSEAETLQKKGLVKYGFVWQGASYEGLTCDFMEYLTDAGGKVLNSKGQPVIDSPQATKALSFMRGLITSGVTPASVVQMQEPQAEDVFDQGNAAFLRNWSYAWDDSNNPKNSRVAGKVGVTVLPSFQPGGGYSTIGGWDLYVNPHSKNLKADLAFINFMTGTQAQTILAKQFSEIPTNAAVANNPSVKAVSPIFNLIPKTKYIARPSQSPNYPQVSQAIYQNVNAALAGNESVSSALKKAQQQIQQAQGANSGL